MKRKLFTSLRTVVSLLLIVTFTLFSFSTRAQSLDSKGTDFWLAFPGNFNGGTEVYLFVSSTSNTTGTVSIPGLAVTIPFSVTAGVVTTVSLPTSTDLGGGSSVVTNKGVHVTANDEVTVYGLSRIPFTTDAYLGLPTDVLGTDYVVLGFKNVNIVNGTQFAVVATQNNTTVTITPSVTTDGHAAGVPFNVILNQGQTYQMRNTIYPNDLSGSLVKSDKPIAVFGGHQCANIPSGSYVACDFIVEQLPPTSAWGKNFVTVPLKTRLFGDTFRFLASTNGTTVRVNGVVVANLNAAQFFETNLQTASQITSNQPILVAQYSNGTSFDNVTSDPFMMLVPPYEQFLGNYIFSTPSSGFRVNFVNVVAPAAAVGSIKLDNVVVPAASFTPIGATGFSGAQLDIGLGSHTLNGTNLPFGIFVYGFNDADSYGYPGGQQFGAVATVTSVSSITTPNGGTSPIGITNCFTSTVRDQFNNPVPGVRVDFTITGTNPGSTGFAFTDGSGVANFCYSGPNVGTDQLVASVGTITSGPALFIWTAIQTNTYYSKSTGDLHNTATWGTNPDGSGTPPTDFGSGKTFNLANRGTAYTMTGNWTVEGTLNIPGSAYLSINGYTLTESFLGGSGSLAGSATSKLVIMGNDGGDAGLLKFTSSGAWLASLTMNRTGTGAAATLTSALSITDVLNVVNGTLNTGGMLTLASSATNTARVAPVMGTINGNVTVERFIPARRAWRILSAPVMGSQSINAAWQEGATTSSANPNPNPGYGTHITEGSAANGFDHNPVTSMTSVLKYISATDSWVGLPNTNSTPVNSDAFMVFIRGDRGVPLSYNNVPPTNTTLRSMGTLKTGDQVFNVAATGFTGIPNPFASPINFATLTRNNVQNNFYLWDPKLGGPNGVGGYVLLSYNGSSYDVTPAAVSPESQYIQSGQGFLVHSTGAAGTLTIKESDKSATPATNVFRSATTIKGIRVTLQVNSKANSTATLDEVLTSFGNFSNEIDNLDAIKLPNIRENLGMTKAGTDLMVERRAMINRDDTIFLKLWNVEQREYELKFTIQNLSSADIQSAYLVDNYLKTTTPISLADGATVKFTIDENQASANAQRFTLVLKANRHAFDGEITMGSSAFKILPNPMTGKTLQLQFINQPKGTYNVELVNSLGQVIYKSQYRHTGGNAMLPVRLGNNVSKGLYQVHITNAAANTKTALQVISN